MPEGPERNGEGQDEEQRRSEENEERAGVVFHKIPSQFLTLLPSQWQPDLSHTSVSCRREVQGLGSYLADFKWFT